MIVIISIILFDLLHFTIIQVEFARRYVNPAPQHETPAAMPTPQKFPQQMDGADTSADSADDAEPGNEQRADGDAATPPSGDPSALP